MNDQIIALYEESNLSIDELCSAFPDMDKDAILMILAAKSSKFRMEAKKDKTFFSLETQENAKMVIEDLLSAEQESVRYRAAKFIINENLGRNNIVTNLKGLNVNIQNINIRLKQAKAAKAKAKKVIDVESNLVAA